MQRVRADIAILGGGIAGLWLLARLRSVGYSVVLLESGRLGGIQTSASQGIIHGGSKYALTGKLSESARAIGAMPNVWRQCLQGSGELDLSAVRVLSSHQYLWSSDSLTSKVAGFFASKAMRSRMLALQEAERPPPFQHPSFNGSLYRLEEPVLDIASLTAELVRQHGEHCYRISAEQLQLDRVEDETVLTLNRDVELRARQLILAAGSGNGPLLEQLGRSHPQMQLRPLHMVVAQGALPPLYAHCIGNGTTPRLTITSYPLADERTAWNIGGQLAESGVERSGAEQIVVAQQELQQLLPWLDYSGVTWGTLRVDRAEPKMVGGRRPDSCFVQSEHGVITVWPTKLALAPRVGEEVLAVLQAVEIEPGGGADLGLNDLQRPQLARMPWEEMEC
jgi:glycerol-3-phosphate dehydrogenase